MSNYEDLDTTHQTISDLISREGTADEKLRSLLIWLQTIGLEDFSDDIRESHFAARVAAIQSDQNERLALEVFEEKHQEEIESKILTIQSALFDKAASYNNAVITLGYAGAFATWSFVAEQFAWRDNLVIAALMSLSLISFVGWTLLVMLKNVRFSKNIAEIFRDEFENRGERIDAILEAEAENAKKLVIFMRFWPIAFSLSVFPALLAGIVLLVDASSLAVGLNFSLIEYIASCLISDV